MIHVFGEYYVDADSNCVTLKKEVGKDKNGNATYGIEGYYTDLADAVTTGFINKLERDLIKTATPDTEAKQIVYMMKSVRDKIAEELMKTVPFGDGAIKLPETEKRNGIAKFYKISVERFVTDFKNLFGDEYTDAEIAYIHENIKLPVRATAGSAGYDFFSPISFGLQPGETINIPTGIRVSMHPDWVLQCYPKSGLGFKFRLQLNNTVGIVDSDYFYSDNEGHIFAKITNDTNEDKTVRVEVGKGFMQGVFVQYGITTDDEATGKRNGGFGSTGA